MILSRILVRILKFYLLLLHLEMSDGNKKFLIKVILLGEAHVGKSSILMRFDGRDRPEGYRPTIAADFLCVHNKLGERNVMYQIWDTAGQERFRCLPTSFLRNTAAFMLVYDICDQESFKALSSWLDICINGSYRAGNDLIVVVVGSKCDDIKGRQVDKAEAEEFCSSRGFQFFEVSGKTGYNVSEAFDYIARRFFLGIKRPLASEALHMYFNNSLISLTLDQSSKGTNIVWKEKDSRIKGIEQSLLYKDWGDSVWEFNSRSGNYILCKALSKEISKAINKPFDKKGKPMYYLWDRDRGIQGNATCQRRGILSSMPGPCAIGEITPIVILSNSALIRSLKDIIKRITPFLKYITRVIVDFIVYLHN